MRCFKTRIKNLDFDANRNQSDTHCNETKEVSRKVLLAMERITKSSLRQYPTCFNSMRHNFKRYLEQKKIPVMRKRKKSDRAFQKLL